MSDWRTDPLQDLGFLEDLEKKFRNDKIALFYEVDFSGKSIIGIDLSRIRFINCNLRGTDLSCCNLSNVDFTNSDLTGAKLEGANLTGAKLEDTDEGENTNK